VAFALGLVLAGSAAAAGGGPKHDFKPADQALALSLVLEWPKDYPSSYEQVTGRDWPGEWGPHCKGEPRESDLTLTGRTVPPPVDGRKASDPQFSSGVLVFRTAGEARTAFEREMRSSLADCLSKGTVAAWASGYVALKLVLVSQTLTRFTISGVQAATLHFVYRFAEAASPLEGFAEDLTVLHKGRVEAWVDTGTTGSKQALAAERPLVAKLAARMP
jgi:hypothetical protein